MLSAIFFRAAGKLTKVDRLAYGPRLALRLSLVLKNLETGALGSLVLQATGSGENIMKRWALFAAVVAGLLLLQFGFVRQLMAAEIVFALALLVLFVLVLFSYLVGSVCERSLQFARVNVRALLLTWAAVLEQQVLYGNARFGGANVKRHWRAGVTHV